MARHINFLQLVDTAATSYLLLKVSDASARLIPLKTKYLVGQGEFIECKWIYTGRSNL